MICLNCAAGADLRTAAETLRLTEDDALIVMHAVNDLHMRCNGCPCAHCVPELRWYADDELATGERCIEHGMLIPHFGCGESILTVWTNSLVETGIV